MRPLNRALPLTLVILLLSGCSGLPKTNLLTVQNEADHAYASGQFEHASEQYRRLAKAMPSDAGVRYQLGNSLARQGDVQGAVASYREALVRNPQHARAWHNLLQVQLREALLSASEMTKTLNPQEPHAEQSLQRAERLLELLEASPPAIPEP
jgi:Flp pilus assembly protein TadD